MLCSIFICYIYFVSASVAHVVLRQEIKEEINSMGSYISELEAKYVEAQHEVSRDIANKSGYVGVEEKIFIERMPETLVLESSNEN